MRYLSVALTLSSVLATVYGATQTVTVGDKGLLAYNPSTVSAQVGDTIQFEFKAKNHSVTQSTFTAPCTRAMFNGSLGVFSGFVAVSNSTQNGSLPIWSITLKSTDPLWFYCSQKNPKSHCQAGMVFSINPTAAKTHAEFLAAAKASGNSSSDAASANSTGGAAPSAGAASSGAGNATSSGTAGAASPPANGTAAASLSTAASSPAGTSAADHSKTNGAPRPALTRGAAGLFIFAAVGAALL